MTAILALAVAATVSMPSPGQVGPVRPPDLSGRWSQSADGGTGGPGAPGWGSQLQIDQSGGDVTVRSPSVGPERYRLDGKETATVLSAKGCVNTTRITTAVVNRDHVTITTWISVKSACVHGEDEDDPLIVAPGATDPAKVFGRRTLESISDIYRDGDALTVSTTRPAPGGVPTSTTTIYRR